MNVEWIPCEERRPDSDRYVWACPWWTLQNVAFAFWYKGNWWVGHQCLKRPRFTHWAEITWPEPPPIEEGDV